MTHASVENWKALSEEERVFQLVNALLLNEVGVADPAFCAGYIQSRARTKDWADRARLDIQYYERVGKLREDGKISSCEKIKQQALGMVDMSADEMRAEMSRLYQEAQQRLEAST